MEKNIIKGKILKIVPDTLDEGNPEHIIDAYLTIEFENRDLEILISNWRQTFPYLPKPSNFGIGSELINNLVGKVALVELDRSLMPKLIQGKILKIYKQRQDNE